MLRILPVLVLLPLPGRACEMALLLATDVSGSVDADEDAPQVKGLADAPDDPGIAGVLVQGQVALAVVQWSGVGAQALVPPRTPKRGRAGVARLAADARARPRAFAASDTAAGQAISFSAAQFAAVPECHLQVIGISGDGPGDAGFTVGQARQAAQAGGIEITAVAIKAMGPSSPITSFCRRRVIIRGGDVMTARGLGGYPRAMRAKFMRELTRPGS